MSPEKDIPIRRQGPDVTVKSLESPRFHTPPEIPGNTSVPPGVSTPVNFYTVPWEPQELA